jgi:PhnB protein
MATVNTYLNFKGNCEFAYIGRFSEMPDSDDYKIPETEKNRIMHVSLPIGSTVLMGSDTGGDWAPAFVQGTNFSISINPDSKEEADKLFTGLSAGGQATMPMSDTFWGAYYGMLTDKFGINWMINFEQRQG